MGKFIKLPEFKISYKRNLPSSPLKQIMGSEDAYAVCKSLYDKGVMDWREEFHVIALSRGNYVIGSFKVSEGGVSGTVADPKIILQFALLVNASFIILTHNHPSGNLKPSEGDINITRKMKSACESMDMQLLDHIITTSRGFTSLNDENII